jgi:hypothetical protein
VPLLVDFSLGLAYSQIFHFFHFISTFSSIPSLLLLCVLASSSSISLFHILLRSIHPHSSFLFSTSLNTSSHRIVAGYGDAERLPAEFTIAPSDAVPRALKHAGLTAADIDYHEINEAFAVVALANAQVNVVVGCDQCLFYHIFLIHHP